MWGDVRKATETLEADSIDMRGRQVEIAETYVDEDGRTIKKGPAFVYKGSTGTLPWNRIPLIFGEDNISTFYPVDIAKVYDPQGRIKTPASLAKIGSGDFYY